MQKDDTSIKCLPPIECTLCGKTLKSDPYTPMPSKRGAQRASNFESCLRRCESCGIGYSNAESRDAKALQRILRDPFLGLPGWVAEGCDRALDECLNRAQKHPEKKRKAFHSFGSEDHATWVAMKLLQREGALSSVFGLDEYAPTMLLWGVPVPNESAPGEILRKKVTSILVDRLREKPDWLTEPDVILDFGEQGIVIIEAKLDSPNDSKSPDYSGWGQYLCQRAFKDPDLARTSGLYQLARNWRLGYELAGNLPFTLVNLAPKFDIKMKRILEKFRDALRVSSKHRFVLMQWETLCAAVPSTKWFCDYTRERGLIASLDS
jgi:hypothetical protein